jgi:hypothetical protein
MLLKFRNAGADEWPTNARGARLRMSRLRGRHRAAAIVVAAAGIVNRGPRGIHDRPAVARMRRLAHTAGMRLLGHGRQRQRDKIAHDDEQQQKPGSQTMHVSCGAGARRPPRAVPLSSENPNPEVPPSIEQNLEPAQAQGTPEKGTTSVVPIRPTNDADFSPVGRFPKPKQLRKSL